MDSDRIKLPEWLVPGAVVEHNGKYYGDDNSYTVCYVRVATRESDGIYPDEVGTLHGLFMNDSNTVYTGGILPFGPPRTLLVVRLEQAPAKAGAKAANVAYNPWSLFVEFLGGDGSTIVAGFQFSKASRALDCVPLGLSPLT